jgi:DNA-binding transcriptional regulator YiaG
VVKVNIKKLRKSLGLTQAQFGELVGVKHAAVCLWESGQRKPSLAHARRLQVILENSDGGREAMTSGAQN